MKVAAGAQKEMMKKINMDQLEDMQEEMRDMMEDQEEIQEILGRDYNLDAYDEAELEQELGDLDEEIVNEKLEGNPVPSAPLPQAQASAKPRSDVEEMNNIMNQ